MYVYVYARVCVCVCVCVCKDGVSCEDVVQAGFVCVMILGGVCLTMYTCEVTDTTACSVWHSRSLSPQLGG